MNKVCKTCGIDKPITEFYKDKSFKEGYRANCKLCKDKSTYAWRESHRAEYNENQRLQHKKHYQRNRLYRYNITPEQHAKLLSDQNGVCALCPNGPTKKRSLATDHDHETGQVRGLLCYKCNRDMNIVDNEPQLAKCMAYRQKTRKAS